MASSHTIGQLVEIGVEFKDPDTKLALDPTTVGVRVENPAGTIVHDWTFGPDPEIVKDAVGKYHANVDGNAAGRWDYHWYSTGAGQAAKKGHFTIAASPAAP